MKPPRTPEQTVLLDWERVLSLGPTKPSLRYVLGCEDDLNLFFHMALAKARHDDWQVVVISMSTTTALALELPSRCPGVSGSEFGARASVGHTLVLIGNMDALVEQAEKLRRKNLAELKKLVTFTAQSRDAYSAICLGSPASLYSRSHGIHSDHELREILKENSFATGGLVDYGCCVVRIGLEPSSI